MASASDRVPNDIKSFLRSVLISSNGVKESKVERDYKELSGERLNWRTFGFNSLREFINAIPDVCRLEYSKKDKENRLYAVEMKGVYMSSHALKNVRSAPEKLESCSNSDMASNRTQSGRKVCQEGDSLKITIKDDLSHGDSSFPELVRNSSGLYQVYVARLPGVTTKDGLRQTFSKYGVVRECDIVLSSQNKKIGFVRYSLKSEAVKALTEGKITPPVIGGQKLDVRLPKSKNTIENRVNVPTTQFPSSLQPSLPPVMPPSEPSRPQQPPWQQSQPSTLEQQPSQWSLQQTSPQQPSLAQGQHHPSPSQLHEQPSQQNLSVVQGQHQQLSGQQALVPEKHQQPPSQQPTLRPKQQQQQQQQQPSGQQSLLMVPGKQQQPSQLNLPLAPEQPQQLSGQRKSLLTEPEQQQLPLPPQPNPSLGPKPHQQLPAQPPNPFLGPGQHQKPPSSQSQSVAIGHQAAQTSTSFTSGEDHLHSMDKLFSVIISGYQKTMTEENLRDKVQLFGNIIEYEYHAMYTIIKFQTQKEIEDVIGGLNGKVYDGSILLVSSLKQNTQAVEEPQETRSPAVSQVNKETDGQFLQIYSVYEEMIGKSWPLIHQQWLDSLPEKFEVKFMEIVNPITYWIHISDGTNRHLEFDDLTTRLQYTSRPNKQNLVNKSEFGVGKFSEDGQWYRCYCYEMSSNLRRVHVLYIDYGNTEWLDRDQVVPLPPVFLRLFPQGVLVQLTGLMLTTDESVNNEAILGAIRLSLDGTVFEARKSSYDPTKPLLLQLELLDSDDVYKLLSRLPGVELNQRPPSPVERIPLSLPPLPPNQFTPIKESLTDYSMVVYIWIVNITSTVTFYFQMANEESRRAISQIKEMLLKCDVQNKVSVRNIKADQLVCYHRNGQERSRVQLMMSNSRTVVPGQINVLHVDTGKEAMVPCTSFISLPSKSDQFPYQARPAILYNVPDDSQPEIIEYAVRLLRGQVLRANILEELPDGTVIVEVYDQNGMSLNKKLIEMIQQINVKHAQNQTARAATQTVQEHAQETHTRAQTEEAPAQNEEARAQIPDTRAQVQDTRAQTKDARAQNEDARAQTQDARAQSQDIRAQMQATRAHTHDERAQTRDARVQTHDARAQTQGTRAQSDEIRAPSQETRTKAVQPQAMHAVSKGEPIPAAVTRRAQKQATRPTERNQLDHGQLQTANVQTHDRGQVEHARNNERHAATTPGHAEATQANKPPLNIPKQSLDIKPSYSVQKPSIRPSILSVDTSSHKMTSQSATSHRLPRMESPQVSPSPQGTPSISPAGSLTSTKNVNPVKGLLKSNTPDEKGPVLPTTQPQPGSINTQFPSTQLQRDKNQTETSSSKNEPVETLSNNVPSGKHDVQTENDSPTKRNAGFPSGSSTAKSSTIKPKSVPSSDDSSSVSNNSTSKKKSGFPSDSSVRNNPTTQQKPSFSWDNNNPVSNSSISKEKSGFPSRENPKKRPGEEQRSPTKNDNKAPNERKPVKRSGGFGQPGRDGVPQRFSRKPTITEQLLNAVADQERILSQPATEQRQLLIQKKMKEKLEVQVGIKKLENEMFVLENELKKLKLEKESLEGQLR